MKVKLYTIITIVALTIGWGVQAQQLDTTQDSTSKQEAPAFVPDSLQISLLTCAPGVEVYELFGHTALRVRYKGNRMFDFVFNYGIFSFDTPNFVWRFTKGETDYCLGVNSFRDFMFSYQSRNSRVDEQILNLSPEQKAQLFEALQQNAMPENRYYRYNFLFDNCATRPRDMVEQTLGGVNYQIPEREQLTFRQEIGRYAARCPWLIFGIDLALGRELDRPMSYREQMFAPEVLRDAFVEATIQLPADSVVTPLVAQSVVLFAPEHPAQPDVTPFFFTPLFVMWLFFSLVVLLSLYDVRRKTCSRWFDTLLFTLYGLAGLLIFFLMFISEHPATSPNYSALWLHPLWLLVAIAIWFKSLKNSVRYYHFANFAGLLLFVLLWHWIPQQFNPAFLPLVLVLIVRSFTYLAVDRMKQKAGEK